MSYEFNEWDFTNKLLLKTFHHTNPLVTQGLQSITEEGFKEQFEKNVKNFKQAQYVGDHAEERHYQIACFSQLQTIWKWLPHAANFSCYHQTINPQTKNLIKSQCQFSPLPVEVIFRVVHHKKNGLDIEIQYYHNAKKIETADCVIHEFALEKENTYYFININDYKSIQWLDRENTTAYAHQADRFLEYIVGNLEMRSKVDRGDFFRNEEIKESPEYSILLSELSDTLLMLTPQFHYGGFLIEGPYKDQQEIKLQGKAYTIFRKEELENSFLNYLQSLHPNFKNQFNGYYFLPFKDAQKDHWFLHVYYEFLEKGFRLIGLDFLKYFRFSKHPAITKIGEIQVREQSIEIEFTLSFGKEKIRNTDLQKIIWAGQKSIMLKDHSIGVLTDGWLAEYELFIKHARVQKDLLVVSKALLLSIPQLNKWENLENCLQSNWVETWKKWRDGEEDIYPTPELLTAQLRPYQHKGFEWLYLLYQIGAGACLADEMGLGKTLQCISLIAQIETVKPGSLYLVICPDSLLYNWKAEFEKFYSRIHVLVYHGAQRRIEQLENFSEGVIITNYGSVRSDIESFSKASFEIAIVDESQNIKNPSAQITQCVYQLQAMYKIVMSGTPVMNNTFDLYSQFKFIIPHLFSTQEFFKREYAVPIDKCGDQSKRDQLQKYTAPFILRRTKKQVATDLPPKSEFNLWCEMDTAQRDFYNDMKSQIRSSVFLNIQEEGFERSKINILAGIIKLRQICCAPQLLDKEDFHSGVSDAIKIKILLDELQDLVADHKVLVFSQFKKMLYLIKDELVKNGISHFHFDGDTPAVERAALVKRFQEPDCDERVFLISLKTGNAGLNLTEADYVFILDPWWNDAVQQQAIDRTHRIGQDKHVFAYKMLCRDSIEERILQLQERKQNLSKGLIDDEGSLMKNLSEEDLSFLFD